MCDPSFVRNIGCSDNFTLLSRKNRLQILKENMYLIKANAIKAILKLNIE